MRNSSIPCTIYLNHSNRMKPSSTLTIRLQIHIFLHFFNNQYNCFMRCTRMIYRLVWCVLIAQSTWRRQCEWEKAFLEALQSKNRKKLEFGNTTWAIIIHSVTKQKTAESSKLKQKYRNVIFIWIFCFRFLFSSQYSKKIVI